MQKRITRRNFLKTGAAISLAFGAKGCKAPERKPAQRQAIQAKPAKAAVHWREKLKQIPKPKSDPVSGLVSKRILLGELVWATQARMLEEGRLGKGAERQSVMPNEPIRTLLVSKSLVEFLQEKKFLPKKKFDFKNLNDYYEARSAWYKYAHSMLKDADFFKYQNTAEKTRMLVAAGKGPEALREVWKHQKVLDTSELARYARSIIEYAKWAK